MAGKYFGIPFALSGDRSAIPDAAQPDGSVSFTQGFTLDYELENTDPDYKPVPREETNALYYDITEAIGIVQKQGFADWTIAAAPYPINAFVRHNDIVWRNSIAANSVEPGTDATWVNETISFVDTINAPIATVAAAGTINLTTGAPNTSQLAISGTGVTINGFTVAANRAFLLRFSGANTLVNSASIVTNTGKNIVTSAGDSCWVRSTAANTIEILCYMPGGSWEASLVDNGYAELPNGLILQWIKTSASGSSSGSLITLPITFPNGVLAVAPTDQTTKGSINLGAIAWSPTQSTKSQIMVVVASGNNVFGLIALGW
ncbi:structural protein [Leptolyngbya phage Lbo-JY16]